MDNIFAEPETYLLRKFIRTRTSLRLILQGLYFQLNDKHELDVDFPGTKS
ncbi:hypothetical protein [Nostoc commune]|nr:hypothetical protein [Nostoc commune]